MNSKIFLILFFVFSSEGFAQRIQKISVQNDVSMSRRSGYYNWKVYLVAHRDTLLKIKEVIYTLHPTFTNPVQKIKASTRNRNFSYNASGWGEFDIKVKIVFIDTRRRPLYLIHHLNLNVRGTSLKRVDDSICI